MRWREQLVSTKRLLLRGPRLIEEQRPALPCVLQAPKSELKTSQKPTVRTTLSFKPKCAQNSTDHRDACVQRPRRPEMRRISLFHAMFPKTNAQVSPNDLVALRPISLIN